MHVQHRAQALGSVLPAARVRAVHDDPVRDLGEARLAQRAAGLDIRPLHDAAQAVPVHALLERLRGLQAHRQDPANALVAAAVQLPNILSWDLKAHATGLHPPRSLPCRPDPSSLEAVLITVAFLLPCGERPDS